MKRTLMTMTPVAVCLALLVALPASAAYEFYMKTNATKQGILKGESTRAQWKDQVPCISMLWEARTPTDAATGLVTGKTQHLPLTVTKEWGASSPQYLQAMLTNEVLKEVTLSFVKADPQGTESVYFTITLRNATVIDYRMRAGEAAATVDTGTARHTAAYGTQELEDISFRYESITVTAGSGTGKTETTGEARGRGA